jgi:hypothetical protein
MTGVGNSKASDREISLALEAWARDLLLLIKSALIYPKGHPTLDAIALRFKNWSHPDKRGTLVIGVTRNELVIDSNFYGGRNKRSTDLAKLLHAKKIKSITFKSDPPVNEVVLLGKILIDRDIFGEEIFSALLENSIDFFAVTILDISKIHGVTSTTDSDDASDALSRGQKAWLWLQTENTDPDQIGWALKSEELWIGAGEEEEEAYKLSFMLTGLGERLEQGLASLGAEEKEVIFSRLSKVGSATSPTQLAEILTNSPEASMLQGEGQLALVGELEGDRLVELMAGIASTDGPKSPRLLKVYKQFAPEGGKEAVLASVNKKLVDGDNRGFATEVWSALETFLLSVGEDGFMDKDYSEMLDDVMSTDKANINYDVRLDFMEPTSPHLDMINIALAMDPNNMEWDSLFLYVSERLLQGNEKEVMALINTIEELFPRALSSKEGLVDEIFSSLTGKIRRLDQVGRRQMREFSKRHKDELFEPILKALQDEESISTRRFLVEALAALDWQSTTPQIIQRARVGPWFVTRNLVMALGLRGDQTSLPFIISTLKNPDERIRKEALNALINFKEEGREALLSFSKALLKKKNERELAKHLLEKMAKQ